MSDEVKTCGNCKHCQKMIPMREGLEPLWVCDEYYGEECPVKVTPPYDEACKYWSKEENE